MLKSNLLLRKGDLCCAVGDMPYATNANLFRTDGMPENISQGECVIYIKSHRGGWPATLWCDVLTKFGIREIRKECLKKEI